MTRFYARWRPQPGQSDATVALRTGVLHRRSALVLLSVAFWMQRALFAVQGTEAMAAEDGTLLRPGMATVSTSRVPPLYAGVPDADLLPAPPQLTPPRPYRWVSEVGETMVLSIDLRPCENIDQSVLTVWDWENRPIDQQVVPVGAASSISFRVQGRGTFLLTLDLFAGGECSGRLARSFAVCPSNREARKWADDWFLGTCAFPGRQHWRNDFGPAHPAGLTPAEARELDAELSARVGLQVVRLSVSASWPAADSPIDFTLMDACVEAWTSRGFKLALQLCNPPDWAILPAYADVSDPKWRYPKRESAARRWVAEVVSRYADRTLFIELLNEPDNRDFWRGTPAEFGDWLDWALEEVQRAAPDLPVASGSYTLIEPQWTGLFARAQQGRVNWVAYHSHGDVRELEHMFGAMRAVHAAAGYENPIFLNTEMGYAAWRLDMERSMAATAVQKVLYCRAHAHRGALLYCSRDIGGPRLSAGDWGFLDHFMCPRFAYGAVAAFIDTLGTARFERTLREDRQLHVYEFAAGDRRLITFYCPDLGSRNVVIEAPAASAVVVDAMGNRQSITMAGPLTLPAGAYPQTIVFEGVGEVRVLMP